MEIELIRKFLNIINTYEISSLQGSDVIIRDQDKPVIDKVRDLAKTNDEFKELVNKLMSASVEEREEILKSLTEQKEEKKDSSEEEELARIYGVSTGSINHLFLKNGKEIFQFYSPDLGRNILLENGKKGESLLSQLKEMQSSNEEYQTDNEVGNSKNIMMDIRNNSNLELSMYPVSEISQHKDEISTMSNDSQRLLQHIITHADELDVQLINIENLIFIDSNNNVREVSFDLNYEPSVGSPDHAEGADDVNTIDSADVKSDSIEGDSGMDDLFDDEQKEDEDDKEKTDEEEKERGKVYQLKNEDDNHMGFVSNSIIVIGVVLLYLLISILFVILS